jgi:hypothetical protein
MHVTRRSRAVKERSMMPKSVTTVEGAVMAWYEIINAKSDSFVADRDAEDLLRHLATALQTEDGPVEAEGFYGLTANGARRYYFSLSPEAVERVERVLALYDARALTAPPELTGMEKIRRL